MPARVGYFSNDFEIDEIGRRETQGVVTAEA